jgi:16S rRNA (adenine1518-N6/adenine1519-N6)-dimethyltransferase
MTAHDNPPPKKSLGQHFLHDKGVLNDIADAADLQPGETVLEIGPGAGALTEILLQRGVRVTAVELDQRMPEHLTQRFPGAPLEILQADFLELDAQALAALPRKVLSNLPYNAATAILQRLLLADPPFGPQVLMFQLEVAKRICSGPGSGDYGIPSIMAALLARTQMVRKVEPGSFFPPPKVRSAVLRLDPLPLTSAQRAEIGAFLDRAGGWFRFRRKTIQNAMKNAGHPPEAISQALETCGVDPRTRPEQIPAPTLLALARLL